MIALVRVKIQTRVERGEQGREEECRGKVVTHCQLVSPSEQKEEEEDRRQKPSSKGHENASHSIGIAYSYLNLSLTLLFHDKERRSKTVYEKYCVFAY